MNNKIKVAVVTLGDSRKDFFLSRINIVNDELQKLKETLGEKYDLYMPDIVYDIEEGQMASDEIIKRELNPL